MSDFSKISSFAKVRRGASPRPIGDPRYFGGNVGWIRISDVTASNKYLRKTEQYVSPLGESLSVRVDKGDLVMSICGTIGRPIIIDMPSCIHDGFVQLFDIKNADTEYLYYILQFHEKDLEGRGQPGTQVNLNTSIVENFEIFIPEDINEQRKIAHILSTIDSVIEKTQSAIDKCKAIKQGMLQDLFTRGINITTGKLRPRYEDAPELYKQSKLGWIPSEWDEKKVVDVAKVNGRVGWKGYTVSDLRDTGALVLGATHIDKENKLDLSKPVHISEDKYLESPEIMIHLGDIIIVQRGTIGKIAIIDREIGEATINPSMVLLNNIRTDNYFLYYQLCSFIGLRQIESLTSQTGVPMISQEQINNIQIAIPKDKIEAAKIAKRITSVDSTLYNEISHLHKLQMLKSGLMSDLLSGKKRVKVNDGDLLKTA